MFKHLLVPIDLSERSERTLGIALELARQSRARVTLFHVVYRVGQIPFDELRGFYERLVKTSEGKLRQAAKRFVGRGVRVSAEVCIGEPAIEIVRAATKNKVDLIVMGSHKVRPARPRPGWGTVSYKVGILCQCPVLLVK